MSLQENQVLDRDGLNRAYVSKTATGTQIMAGSLRLLGSITIDGVLNTKAIEAGNNTIKTTGTITAGTFSGAFSGNGASITNLNATNLATGTVADARLSSNILMLNKAQTITAHKTFSTAANLYFAGGTTYWISNAGDAKFNNLNIVGNITFDGNKKLIFSQSGIAPPSDDSVGTKIQVYGNRYQLGIDNAALWYDAHTRHEFYTNSATTTRTKRFEVNTSGITVTGDATITNNVEIQGELKAGGANEFPDPLLVSKSTSGWTSTRGTIEIDPIQTPPGTNAVASLKTTATAADQFIMRETFFSASPNEWITFSAYVFSTTASKTGQLWIYWYDAAGTVVASNSTTFTASTSWNRHSYTAQAPATATRFKVRIDNDGGTGTIMYFSAFQVERGRTLTGFKPYGGGDVASFFDKGIKLGNGGEIHSGHNNNYILKDHANGNITLSAAGKMLYLGYQTTESVNLSSKLIVGTTTNVIGTDGTLYYKGENTDTRYVNKTGDTLTGDLIISKSNAWLTLKPTNSGENGTDQAAGITIGEAGHKGSAALHLTYTGDGRGHIGMGTVDATTGRPLHQAMELLYTNNVVKFFSTPNVNGSTVWHAGNDGAGSGLDADLLDGLNSSDFLRSNVNSTFAGTLTVTSIVNAQHIQIADPGFNEGIEWLGGNKWKMFESDDILGNNAGNLQVTTATAAGTTGKMFTFRTDGDFELRANGRGALRKVNTIYFDFDGNYGSTKFHSISSESSDGLWMNSFGNITLNIDSNSNTVENRFRVARHSTADDNPLFDVTDTLLTSHVPMYGKTQLEINDGAHSLIMGVRSAYANDAASPHIWASSGGAEANAAFPSVGGHLVIEGRNLADRHIIIRTVGVERMRIQGNGNVGIGTASPAHRLDVSGDINVTGSIRSATTIPFLNGGNALGINVAKILVSTSYADETKVPTSGAYIQGAVLLNNNLSFTAGQKSIVFATSEIRDNGSNALVISGTGNVYLRPNGDAATSGQFHLSTNSLTYTGTVSLTGATTITGAATVSGITTINNRLKINGTSGRTDAPTIDLALGDSDTGLKWNSDGNFSLMANSVATVTVSATGIALGNRDITGIKILSGQYGTMMKSTDEWLRINDDGSHATGTFFGTTTVRTDGEYQVGASGASFKANSSGVTIKNKIRMQWNDTEGSLDFVLV